MLISLKLLLRSATAPDSKSNSSCCNRSSCICCCCNSGCCCSKFCARGVQSSSTSSLPAKGAGGARLRDRDEGDLAAEVVDPEDAVEERWARGFLIVCCSWSTPSRSLLVTRRQVCFATLEHFSLPKSGALLQCQRRMPQNSVCISLQARCFGDKRQSESNEMMFQKHDKHIALGRPHPIHNEPAAAMTRPESILGLFDSSKSSASFCSMQGTDILMLLTLLSPLTSPPAAARPAPPGLRALPSYRLRAYR